MAASLYRASVRTGVRMVHNRWSAGGGQIRPELRVASQCTKTAQELSDQVMSVFQLEVIVPTHQ